MKKIIKFLFGIVLFFIAPLAIIGIFLTPEKSLPECQSSAAINLAIGYQYRAFPSMNRNDVDNLIFGNGGTSPIVKFNGVTEIPQKDKTIRICMGYAIQKNDRTSPMGFKIYLDAKSKALATLMSPDEIKEQSTTN